MADKYVDIVATGAQGASDRAMLHAVKVRRYLNGRNHPLYHKAQCKSVCQSAHPLRTEVYPYQPFDKIAQCDEVKARICPRCVRALRRK